MMKLLRDRRGSQMVEYVILIAVVALLSIAAFRKFGFKVRSTVDTQSAQVAKDDDELGAMVRVKGFAALLMKKVLGCC